MSRTQVHSKERKKIVADVCRRFPTAGNLTLGKKLLAECPGLFSTVEAARQAVLKVRGRGNSEDAVRAKRKGTYQPPRKAGYVNKIPESLSKPWEPFVVENPGRVLVISDIHVPFQDTAALKVTMKFGDHYNPQTILINGDLLDFQGISRWARDPRGPTVREELDICAEFIRHLRERFKKARIIFKLGNHDERWEKMLWLKAPELLDCIEFAWHDLAGFGECGVEVVGEQRIVMLGKLPVLHGHELPKGLTNSVNPARGAFLRTNDTVLVGHFHRGSQHPDRSLTGRIVKCWSTGCLCDLTPEYARVNKWNHGFATVDVHKTGEFNVVIRDIVEGAVR